MKSNSDTKLIILEGLPGTGKSTNSGFLLSQFERNGINAKWFHEDSRPHPTSFFYEACLSEKEYGKLIEPFTQNTKKVLDSIKNVRHGTISFDLLDIKWNYLDSVGKEVYDALSMYDVWDLPLEKYIDLALEKWELFVNQVDEIVILDSSFFQFQIYTFLLENTPFTALEAFVNRLSNIISSLNPVLIYLYRNNVEDTIAFLEENRGISFLEQIWERDKHLPYYKNKPNGAEGYREFLRDYNHYAERLFQSVPFEKYSIEISDGRWDVYESRILKHFNLEKTQAPQAQLQQGIYKNHKLDMQIVVNGLEVIDPMGKKKKLVPRSVNEFYIEDLPVILHFETPEKLILMGQQLNPRWTTYGTEYLRYKE